MTVSTVLNKITLIGDGVTTAFTFPFAIRPNGQTDIQVFLTTAAGVITQLTYATQYTVTENAAIAPNPTPVGGTVNCTTAPANGVLVTILRTMALTQPTSLANQGNLYQPVLESTDDNQAMQLQQLSELLGRMISVAVSDPAPLNLPAVAQRANLAFMFDSSGNPIAAAPGGANAPVSSAMAPVVNAATIAAAVALLGLTGVAVEPTGVIKAWAGTSSATPPTGYLLCGGQAVSRATFAALFTQISTTFGTGDGSTTFNVPDLRGRVIAGLDNINGVTASRLSATTIPNGGGPTTLGGNGGTETNTITTAKMPSHTHTANSHSHTSRAEGGTAGASQAFTDALLLTQGGAGFSESTPLATTSVTVTINNTGGGTALEIVQPTICLNYIIKT